MNKKEIRAWLILIAWILIGTSPVVYAYVSQEGSKEEIWIEATEDVPRFDMEEVVIEQVETETVTESTEEVSNYEGVKFYDIPLSEELQMHIFYECDGYNIAPSIIIAWIEHESDFNASAIGDNGNSFGLMQIQPKWHQERMQRLGCTDLLDPYQNVTVGINIVAELKDKNPDLYWVLMAYNGGEDYATRKIKAEDYSDYAVEITQRASELEAEYEYLQSLAE